MVGGFDSGMAKIIRAMKQRKTIEDAIAEYARRRPYRKIVEPDGKAALKIIEQPPIEISILAGEVIYQLRSALDHFFFDLVQRNGAPLTSKQIRSCFFPLCTKRPVDFGPIAKHNLLKDYQLRIPEDAFTLIEGLQPYNRWHDGHHLLRMLAKFSNIDKHRHLTTTIVTINRTHTIVGKSGFTSTVIMPMLNDGAKIYEPWHPEYWPHPGVEKQGAIEVEDKYIVTVAFDEPEFGPFQTAPIELMIYDLPTFIFDIGVNLRKFLT